MKKIDISFMGKNLIAKWIQIYFYSIRNIKHRIIYFILKIIMQKKNAGITSIPWNVIDKYNQISSQEYILPSIVSNCRQISCTSLSDRI